MTKYKVAIIGCGSIGALKPDEFDSPGGKNILTHAHAFHEHPQTKISCFVDKEISKAIKAADKWGGEWYDDIHVALHAEKPDIVVVAVDTSDHALILLQALSYGPSLVIGEKPFCGSYGEAKIVADCYVKAGIPLMINYTRRFLPSMQELSQEFKGSVTIDLSPEDPKVTSWINWCCVKYTRGLIREASHAIDLCNLFFGEFQSGKILSPSSAIMDLDLFPDDPTYGAILRYSGCPFVYFCPQDGRDYNIFELEISTRHTIISLTDNGARIRRRELEPSIYGNYKTISDGVIVLETKIHRGLSFMADNVVGFLENREPLMCTAKNALEVHKVLAHLLQSGRE